LIKMLQGGLPNRINVKAHFEEGLMIEDVTPIKDESRVCHGLIDTLIIQLSEIYPISKQSDGMSTLCSLLRIGDVTDLISLFTKVLLCIFKRMGIA